MTRARLVAVACAAAALATSGAAVAAALSAKDWKVSSLVRMSDAEPMAAIARGHEPDFAFVPITSHYDGVYFYAIALDPLGRGEAAEAIRGDRGPYRYGHAGYGWLAWAVSLGRPSAVPEALLLLALAGVAAGAAATSLLARELGVTPWAGLGVAFNPGIVYAATVLTSETVGVALLMLSLLAWVRGRRVAGAALLTAACLTKEPFLLVPVGIGLYELGRMLGLPRGGFSEKLRALPARLGAVLRTRELWRTAGLLLIGPAIFGLWYLYLIARFDVVPHTLVEDLTQWPFTGWVDSARMAAGLGLGSFDQAQIGAASLALIAAAGLALAAGLVAALRFASPISGPYIGLALIAFSLSWLGVLYPKDLIREISMPASLLPFAFAARSPDAGRRPDATGSPDPVG